MKMIRNLILGILVSICMFAMNTTLTAQVINEVQSDNPGTDICEYIELRGTPGTAVGANLYLVEFEGDGSTAGVADFARDVSSDIFGANGIISYIAATTCTSRDYSVDGGTTVIDSSFTPENGTISFLLIRSPTTPITSSTDYDTDNNGTLEGLPVDAVIVDALGWSDGGGTDLVYGGVDVTPSTGEPMAATRNFNNTMPLTASAWFADIIVGGQEAVLYSQTNLLGGYMIDFITPGRQNLAPTAAPGMIQGRARFANGRGIKHAVIMLTGGNLDEPIYATTNQFGYYKFQDVGVGQSYVLQITSRRYTFQNSSRVVNLEDSLTNEDFIVDEPSKDSFPSPTKKDESLNQKVITRRP